MGGDGGGGGEVEPACDDKEDDCSDPANLLRLESALNAVSFYERHGWVRDAAEGKVRMATKEREAVLCHTHACCVPHALLCTPPPHKPPPCPSDSSRKPGACAPV